MVNNPNAIRASQPTGSLNVHAANLELHETACINHQTSISVQAGTLFYSLRIIWDVSSRLSEGSGWKIRKFYLRKKIDFLLMSK